MKTKLDQYIEDKTTNGDPFYTVTSEEWKAGKVAQIRNLCCANQAPTDWAIMNVQMPDGSRVKAVMRMDDLLKKVGSTCANMESLGHKDKIHRWLRFALHRNTIAQLLPSDFSPSQGPNPNGTALPSAGSEEVAERKTYESWVADKEKAA
jgi:hypothetical protein